MRRNNQYEQKIFQNIMKNIYPKERSEQCFLLSGIIPVRAYESDHWFSTCPQFLQKIITCCARIREQDFSFSGKFAYVLNEWFLRIFKVVNYYWKKLHLRCWKGSEYVFDTGAMSIHVVLMVWLWKSNRALREYPYLTLNSFSLLKFKISFL